MKQKIEIPKYITIEKILWLVLIIWRIPFINKGIDYLDSGFAIVNYANVFKPGGINDISIFYTTLLGGIIYRLLPAGQYLAYRILHWLIGLATMALTCKLVKKYIPERVLLLAFIAVSFFNRTGESFYGYFNLSGLITILFLFFMVRGVTENKNWKIFLAGFIAGINIFVRLSNVLFLPVAFGIVLYGCCVKKEKKTVAKQFFIAVGGVGVSFVVTFLIMLSVMGIEQITASFMDYVMLALGQPAVTAENVLGIEEMNGHSLSAEFHTVKYQFLKSGFTFAVAIIPILLCKYLIDTIIKKANRGKAVKVIAFSVIIAVFAAVCIIFTADLQKEFLWLMGLLSMLLSFCFLLNFKKEDPEIMLLCFANLWLSFTSAWGSDGGLSRFSIVRPIQTAVILICVLAIQKRTLDFQPGKWIKQISKKHSFPIYKTATYAIFAVFVGIFVTGITTLPVVFSDDNVDKLKVSVNKDITVLAGMKTSDIRAREINQYYELMNSEKLADKEVAIFGYWALGEAIGPQEGYFDSVLSCIDYPRVNVESLLEVINNKETEGTTPIIVVSMVDAIQNDMDSPNITKAKQAVLKYMLSLHEYEIYADTEYFTIYVPSEQ